MSGKNQFEGSFDINFNTRKEFTAFGMRYAECAANMNANAKFEKPITRGGLRYEVNFSAECECSAFGYAFKKAYDKTFRDGTLAVEESEESDFVASVRRTIEVKDPDYHLELMTCRRKI